ncbi:MAG: hypothetical protein PF440_05870 [Thiomicrorhabdus sp.]|jgi:hypothetical protein|nr:hypothetical protein [Thiomicrorhabdus sp.]
MTTYNFTNGSIEGHMVPPNMEIVTSKPTILRNIVDCAKQNLDAGVGDIGQVLIIPAGTLVLECGIRIITAETANGTLDLGVTTTNAAQWGVALAVDSTAGTILGMLAAPLYFATADTIDVLATIDTADIDLDGLKFEVFAVCIKVQDSY